MARLKKAYKALLEAFGENYNLLENDGGYLLYDKKQPGKRSNYKYLGKFYLSTNGDSYSFEDNYYSTVPELLDAMNQWAESLPFDTDVYNPSFRKNYQVECALHDYLEELGFKYGISGNNDSYTLYDCYGKNITNLIINVDEDSTSGTVIRSIDDFKWQESKFTDLDSAIGSINSILSGYVGIVQAQLLNVLKALTQSRAAVTNLSFDTSSFTTFTEDATQKTIKWLEAELKRLKGETYDRI